MTPEQAFILALDNTPVHLPGFFHMVASGMKDEEKLTEMFRSGKGVGWPLIWSSKPVRRAAPLPQFAIR